MGLLSKSPVASEDGLLVSENAASNLLSLAAQIALEVGPITGLVTRLCTPVVKMGKEFVWSGGITVTFHNDVRIL